MRNNFKVGDTVIVRTVVGEQDMRVVEVWCDCEPYYLLVTDVEGLTLKTNSVSAYDCELKYRPEDIPVKNYRKNEPQKTTLIDPDLYKPFNKKSDI